MTEDTKLKEDTKILEEIGDYKYGFHDRDDNYVFKSERGLNRQVVENISRMKAEPQWMLDFRLKNSSTLQPFLRISHAPSHNLVLQGARRGLGRQIQQYAHPT